MIEGWSRLGSFVFHYCRLNDIGGCGQYRAVCGAKGWVDKLMPLTDAVPWCPGCVKAIDEQRISDVAFELEPAANLPPGQVKAKKWTVLHLGLVPVENPNYDLLADGFCEPHRWTVAELGAFPKKSLRADMHCIMRWTMEGLEWRGIPMSEILQRVKPTSEFVMVHAENDYRTNLRVADLAQGILATDVGNEPLPPIHGGPLRLVIPHLYAWKSAKWVRRLEFVAEDKPGTWEQRGLHNRGDVWKEERFAKNDNG